METYSEKNIKYCPYTNLIFDSRNVMHNHTFFEFSFVIKGECINHLNGYPKPMTVGDAVILTPQSTHSIEIKTHNHYIHRDVYCSKEKMKLICDTLDPTLFDEIVSSNGIYFTISNSQLKYLELALNTFNGFGSTKSPQLDALSTAIISSILGIYIENKIVHKNNHPQWLNTFLDKLNSAENMSQNIESLIKETNYSHGYVCREFKKYTGKTVIQYVTEAKIHYSTNLLKNSNMSILSIASYLGYDNPNNYIRHFKSLYNMPPNHWRKKYMSINI